MSDPDQGETYSEEETVAGREAALKRAFAKPRKASKVGQRESQAK